VLVQKPELSLAAVIAINDDMCLGGKGEMHTGDFVAAGNFTWRPSTLLHAPPISCCAAPLIRSLRTQLATLIQ
jgi:hypothetical protein